MNEKISSQAYAKAAAVARKIADQLDAEAEKLAGDAREAKLTQADGVHLVARELQNRADLADREESWCEGLRWPTFTIDGEPVSAKCGTSDTHVGHWIDGRDAPAPGGESRG